MRTLRAAIGLTSFFAIALILASSSAAGAQTISAKPPMLAFTASACANDPPAQSVEITSTGGASLSWQVASPTPPGFSVSPTSGTAPTTITVEPPAGLPVGAHRFTLVVNSNDPLTPTVKIEIVVVIRPCLPPNGRVQQVEYEVALEARGFAGEFSTLPDCKVNTNGFDRLHGGLAGYELNTPDDDVIYEGVLFRETRVDYCLTRGRRQPSDDERVYCTVSLVGLDVTWVQLQVHGDSARGAWMKAESYTGNPAGSWTVATRTVTSNCDPQETRDVRDGYPLADDGGGLSPNGQQIDDLSARDPQGQPVTFFRNRVAKLRLGTYPPDKRLGTGNGWTLVVIRKIR